MSKIESGTGSSKFSTSLGSTASKGEVGQAGAFMRAVKVGKSPALIEHGADTVQGQSSRLSGKSSTNSPMTNQPATYETTKVLSLREFSQSVPTTAQQLSSMIMGVPVNKLPSVAIMSSNQQSGGDEVVQQIGGTLFVNASTSQLSQLDADSESFRDQILSAVSNCLDMRH